MNEEQQAWFDKLKKMVADFDATTHADPNDYDAFVTSVQEHVETSPEP